MPTATLQRIATAAPRVPATYLLGATSVIGFGGLLIQDQVPALLVYCLQVFLAA